MYSKILVAVDDSAYAGRALAHALDLARESGAALRVVHVVDMGLAPVAPELGIDTRARAVALRVEGQAAIDAAMAAVREAGLEAEPLLLETMTPTESVAQVIVEAAVDWAADLLVLGTHGRSGIERLVLGSVADGVVRRSPVPVLLMPPRAAPQR